MLSNRDIPRPFRRGFLPLKTVSFNIPFTNAT
jgi:hypothetical protein